MLRLGVLDETSWSRLVSWRGDVFGRRRDGTEFHAEIGLQPISSESGRQVLVSVVDITARKVIEARLQSIGAMEALNREQIGRAHV